MLNNYKNKFIKSGDVDNIRKYILNIIKGVEDVENLKLKFDRCSSNLRYYFYDGYINLYLF